MYSFTTSGSDVIVKDISNPNPTNQPIVSTIGESSYECTWSYTEDGFYVDFVVSGLKLRRSRIVNVVVNGVNCQNDADLEAKLLNILPNSGVIDNQGGGSGVLPDTKQTLTDAATVAWNFASGKNAQVTLGGNRTLAISNDADQDIALLKVIQDGTGGRQLSLPANCRVVNDGAGLISLSTDPAAEDLVSFYKDGDDFYVNVSRNFTKPTVYDTDAQAYFTAAGITDVTQKDAWNAFVVAAKAKSYWSKFQAIYPFIGGTAASHKWNAKNPVDSDAAFRLTFHNSPTHAANGVTFGGTSYADSKYIPSTHGAQNNMHISRICTLTGALWAMGSANTTGSTSLTSGGDPIYASINSGGSYSPDFISGLSGVSMVLASRDNSANFQMSRNGSWVTKTRTSESLLSHNMAIGGLNYAGTFEGGGGQRLTMATIGTAFTSQNALDFYTDAAALQTALGR